MNHMIRYLFCSIVALQIVGCLHRIRVESFPPGATVYHKNNDIGTTPLEKTIIWYPFLQIPMEIRLPNYRSVNFNAQDQLSVRKITLDIFTFRYKKWLGIEPRVVHNIYMIREHGPTGTWTPEDAKKTR
jgi:hypothetical protein